MKISTSIALASAILALGVLPAGAVPSKQSRTALAQHEASCKAQAAKKFSVIHFMKRRDFVNNCMGRTAHAKSAKVAVVKPHKKAKPTTTGQAVR